MTSNFGNISKQVFLERPALGDIMEKFGHLSLRDYVQNNFDIPSAQPDKLFLDILKQRTEILYDSALAGQLEQQLKRKPLISTIDHLGIWGHPFFVNSSLIFSLAFGTDELMPVLATESVSLNNVTSWSASLLYHESGRGLRRRSFLPDRLKTLPVFSAPAIGPQDLKRLSQLSNGHFQRLLNVLNLNDRPYSGLSAQACVASGRLWQAVFPSAPKLLYLPLETAVNQYLLQVFKDPDHLLSRIILTVDGRKLWSQFFTGDHTFMFWQLDNKGRRQAVSELPKQQAEFLRLINERRLYPSSPLCFVILLAAGLACAGGFNQTTWLSRIKENFLRLLDNEVFAEYRLERQTVLSAAGKNFAETSLAWLGYEGGYVPPTAPDLFFSGQDYYPKYLKLAESLGLEQSFNLALPDIYSVVAHKAGDKDFNALTIRRALLDDLGIKKLLLASGI